MKRRKLRPIASALLGVVGPRECPHSTKPGVTRDRCSACLGLPATQVRARVDPADVDAISKRWGGPGSEGDE